MRGDASISVPFPSYERIARLLKVGRTSVAAALRVLEKRGLITVTRRRKHHGERETNLYVVNDVGHPLPDSSPPRLGLWSPRIRSRGELCQSSQDGQ